MKCTYNPINISTNNHIKFSSHNPIKSSDNSFQISYNLMKYAESAFLVKLIIPFPTFAISVELNNPKRTNHSREKKIDDDEN